MGAPQNQELAQHSMQQDASLGARSGVTFFTISNDKYFPGLVGLLNSLKLMGHNEPVVVGDCGLTAAQRELLAPHCKLFELNSQLVRNPTQYKPFPFLLRPRGTVVFIDSDMIVTRSLSPVLALAAQGKICAFPDPDYDTWWAEWQEIFDLPCAPRKQTYVCCGFVAFSTTFWPELLERWWKACERIRERPTYQEGAKPLLSPTGQGDQDALNAVLMSVIPADALSLLPSNEKLTQFQSPHVGSINERTLACQYQGKQPLILHASLQPKPWQWWGVSLGGQIRGYVYLRFLRRLLTASDVALKVPTPMLKIWLRQGIASDLAVYGLAFANFFGVRFLVRVVRRLVRVFKKRRQPRVAAI
jgi:hypothetical protein